MRKLAKECDRVQRVVNVITNLRKDVHPFKGTALTVPARRMLKADVGCKLSLLDPLFASHVVCLDFTHQLALIRHTVGCSRKLNRL